MKYTIELDYDQADAVKKALSAASDRQAELATIALRKNDFNEASHNIYEGKRYQNVLTYICDETSKQALEQYHASHPEEAVHDGTEDAN